LGGGAREIREGYARDTRDEVKINGNFPSHGLIPSRRRLETIASSCLQGSNVGVESYPDW
jgi:hypothetical protein